MLELFRKSENYSDMRNISRKIISLTVFSILVITLHAQVVDFIFTNPCVGSETHFISTSTYAGGIGTYTWNFGDGSSLTGASGNVFYAYSNPGAYLVTLQIFDVNGAFISQIVKNVKVFSPPVAGFEISPACFGSETVFKNETTSDSTEALTWYWNFGDGEGDVIESPKHTYGNPGYFPVTLIVESNTGCRDTSDIVNAHVFALPDATIRYSSDEICKGDSVTMNVILMNSNTLVLWSTGETTPEITVKPDTSLWYVVTVYEIHYSDLIFCEISEDIFITVHSTPQITIVNDTTNLPGQNYLTVQSDFNITQYIWSPMESLSNPYSSETYANPTYLTTYTVSVTDEYGCHNAASITLGEIMKLYLNNLITPNNDGKNDIWTVGDKNLTDLFEVYIYNRWGEEVYSAKGYYITWDGMYQDNLLPDGAYYYLIKHKGSSYTGAITLIK
jgi:gliding motility-associated-like protein